MRLNGLVCNWFIWPSPYPVAMTELWIEVDVLCLVAIWYPFSVHLCEEDGSVKATTLCFHAARVFVTDGVVVQISFETIVVRRVTRISRP
jgi:hypothetical protein